MADPGVRANPVRPPALGACRHRAPKPRWLRLAGLPEAQALFQVVADGLLADFPALRIGEA
jgi:hypothetical protein